MRNFLLAGVVLLFAAPAFAQSMGEKSGVNSALGIAPKTQDFVTQAAISDMFEIESSKLAQTKANAKNQQFATKMIEDHTKTSTELKALVSSGKVKAQLPAQMDEAHTKMIDKLRNLSGDDFNEQYADDQEDAHEDAVSLFQRYADEGDNTDLKAFAAKHLPHLKEHLKIAEGLDE